MPERRIRRDSLRGLVVNLRCEWCKELFPWKPPRKTSVLERLPRTCSSHCSGRLQQWKREKIANSSS